MPSVASLERYALQPPEHDDTEQDLCDDCGCPIAEDDYCSYCEEVFNHGKEHLANVA
jgi:hypothetical protein